MKKKNERPKNGLSFYCLIRHFFLFRSKRQKCNSASPFDSKCHLALMFCAVA
jgi:hypothetical protein